MPPGPAAGRCPTQVASAAGQPSNGLTVEGTPTDGERTVTDTSGASQVDSFDVPSPSTVDDLQVTFDNTPTSTVRVIASAHFGGEVLEVYIDGVVVASWVLAVDPDF